MQVDSLLASDVFEKYDKSTVEMLSEYVADNHLGNIATFRDDKNLKLYVDGLDEPARTDCKKIMETIHQLAAVFMPAPAPASDTEVEESPIAVSKSGGIQRWSAVDGETELNGTQRMEQLGLTKNDLMVEFKDPSAYAEVIGEHLREWQADNFDISLTGKAGLTKITDILVDKSTCFLGGWVHVDKAYAQLVIKAVRKAGIFGVTYEQVSERAPHSIACPYQRVLISVPSLTTAMPCRSQFLYKASSIRKLKTPIRTLSTEEAIDEAVRVRLTTASETAGPPCLASLPPDCRLPALPCLTARLPACLTARLADRQAFTISRRTSSRASRLARATVRSSSGRRCWSAPPWSRR